MEFETLEKLKVYTEKMNTFEEGEIARADGKLYIFKNGEWVLNESGVTISLYEINKQIMNQMPAHNSEELYKDKGVIDMFNFNCGYLYYMLLCRDINYYTLFQSDCECDGAGSLGDEVLECLENIGDILNVEYSGQSVEIWIREHCTQEPMCLYLFGYDDAIVKFMG